MVDKPGDPMASVEMECQFLSRMKGWVAKRSLNIAYFKSHLLKRSAANDDHKTRRVNEC